MPIDEGVNKFKSRVSWSLWGVILAAIFGATTLYTEFIRDVRPEIQFEIVSNSSVLDVREQVPNLAIIYSGTDLTETNQSLRVIIVRVKNVGSEDVLKSYYDEKAPLGIAIAGGSIISVDLQDTSEKYLTENLVIQTESSSQATFSPVILGSNQHFTVKALIIHAESSEPSISPTGRIARVSSIRLTSSQELQEPGFWTQVFSGSLLIHATRLPIYFIGLIVAILAIGIPTSLMNERWQKQRRKAHVKEFKEQSDNATQRAFTKLFSKYIEHGMWIINEIEKVNSEEFDLNHTTQKIEYVSGKGEDSRGFHKVRRVADGGRKIRDREPYSTYLVAQMMDYGWIEVADVGHTINPDFKTTFERFLGFLSTV